jgi:hypothetical protein
VALLSLNGLSSYSNATQWDGSCPRGRGLSVLPETLTPVSADDRAMQLDRRAARLLERQHGVLSRRQALELGVTQGALRHRLRPGGPWQRLLPGTYLTASAEPAPEQREIAALLYAGPGSVVTGLAALRYQWIRVDKTPQVDVLVPAGCFRRSAGFAVLHRTRRMPETTLVARGVDITMAPRAVIDAVSWLTSLSAARALMAAAVQSRRCTIADLQAELRAGPRHDTALVRRVLAEVAAGVRSGPEGDLGDLIVRHGLPAPLFNPRLYLNGTFLACPDAWWQEAGVAVEVDSREWHFSTEESWQDTMRRHSRMTAAGILVIHVTPKQLHTEPGRVGRDIAAALDRGRCPAGIVARPAAA